MTGEELNRKYHELCDWVAFPGNGAARAVWHKAECQYKNFGWTSRCIGFGTDEGCRDELPALHLDANLAIAEADKVFRTKKSNEPMWQLDREADGFYFRGVYLLPIDGTTPNEAILKALIAAKEQQ